MALQPTHSTQAALGHCPHLDEVLVEDLQKKRMQFS
jgi:hypothetical protein